MAGMLPGVEAARRRRVHQSSSSTSTATASSSLAIGIGSCPSSRRSSVSLFSSSSFLTSGTIIRSRTYQDDDNYKLGPLAREAKGRLDAKLRAQSLVATRNSSGENTNSGRTAVRKEGWLVFGSKKKKKKRLLAKLGWKSGEQKECAVCLDEFKEGDDLLNLPCAHTFHSTCLLPWLHTNAHCPCCRFSI